MQRTGRVVGIVVAAAAVVAVGAVVGASAVHAAAGETFVADVHWSSAVVASRGSTTVTVSADVEGMDARFTCGPVVRPTVSETARSVSIRVAVLDRPLPPGVACGGVGLTFVPATVHLAAPLGRRVLVDATGGADHPALIVDRTPAPTAVPEPFVRRETGWDESTGQVHEWWRWQRHGQAQQIDLDLGPTATLLRQQPVPRDATRATIGGRPGSVARAVEGDTVMTTVTWSPSSGRTARLVLFDQTTAPMSADGVLAIARSIR